MAASALFVAVACEQRPPLEWEGEHVRVGSDVVDEVCGGSIARMDYVAEQVGDQLGLGLPDERHEIWILTPERFAAACRTTGEVVGCSDSREGVTLRATSARTGMAHELAHERVREELGTKLKPFFEEGIAEAIQALPCQMSGEVPSLDALLAASSGAALGTDGYCYAGEFMTWLLANEDPARVLAFHGSIDRKTDPDPVRASYYSRFGRTLEDDLAQPRPPFAGGDVHCFAPELERLELGHYGRFVADTTCSGSRVENDFANPERIYVEWQLTITEAEAGHWQLVGDLPVSESFSAYPFVELSASFCEGSGARINSKLLAAGNLARDRVKLEPGSYWLRLVGLRDTPVEVDLLFSGPCTYGADQCGPEHRCDGEVCIPRASTPLAIGSPCTGGPLAGDPCDDGSRCVGGSVEGVTQGSCTALCTSDADCSAPSVCHGSGLCGVPCEQSSECEAAQSCIAGSFGSSAVCLPNGDVGIFGSCVRDTDCADDLVCHNPGYSAIGCSDPLGGCLCTQACDLGDPSCSIVLPSCKPEPDGSRTTCQPS